VNAISPNEASLAQIAETMKLQGRRREVETALTLLAHGAGLRVAVADQIVPLTAKGMLELHQTVEADLRRCKRDLEEELAFRGAL
jgi:hypothetical protein